MVSLETSEVLVVQALLLSLPGSGISSMVGPAQSSSSLALPLAHLWFPEASPEAPLGRPEVAPSLLAVSKCC